MSGVWLCLRLVVGFGVVLAPGVIVARALLVTGVPAGVAWGLLLIFGAMTVTFVASASLTLTVVLVPPRPWGSCSGSAAGRRSSDARRSPQCSFSLRRSSTGSRNWSTSPATTEHPLRRPDRRPCESASRGAVVLCRHPGELPARRGRAGACLPESDQPRRGHGR